LFFFSSRRRHTRCLSDWSSDVCSSDLIASGLKIANPIFERLPLILVGFFSRGLFQLQEVLLKLAKRTLPLVMILCHGVSVTEPSDRKSTRLNSSHLGISYAVFCLKKKT